MNYKIGDIIEQIKIKNGNPNHSNVSGINILKQFMPSKNVGADTSKYLVVPHNCFACNLMHVGRDERIPVAMNANDDEIVVSSAYFVFQITKTEKVLPEYLNMIFQSSEFDRYAWFCTDTSIRGNLDWKRFCDIDIDLPPLEIQAKYVAVYKAMVANQQSYETGLEDLKLVCDATIEKFRREMKSEAIGSYINEVNNKNIDKEVTLVQGVESSGQFMPTKAKMAGIDISKYNIVEVDDIVYNPSRINIGSVAISTQRCIVSPMYEVFRVDNTKKLLPQYLMMWLGRKETQRYTLFKAMGSVRDTFDFGLMKEYEIPIPDINLQKSIVDIYNTYITRRELNEKLKSQIKDICPILISGAVKETRSNVKF